ncbi:hypothetical protein [Halosolutus halophilus]|uniref:hypothetical protein n=1 Tax=Halosolutus halophilus TaxID=1552990 RepID=UPI002234EC98|nr:hypothetical protein [Halosolutus halophilus]
MTAKYSTGRDDATHWESDTRHVMAEWSTKPFTGFRHRHETVEHRLVVEYTHGVGVDIRHEVRSEESSKFSGEWSAVETLEVREYGARLDRQLEARWLQ